MLRSIVRVLSGVLLALVGAIPRSLALPQLMVR